MLKDADSVAVRIYHTKRQPVCSEGLTTKDLSDADQRRLQGRLGTHRTTRVDIQQSTGCICGEGYDFCPLCVLPAGYLVSENQLRDSDVAGDPTGGISKGRAIWTLLLARLLQAAGGMVALIRGTLA